MSKFNIKRAPSSVNYSVRLVPDLSAAAFRTKTTKELALWHCLRAINRTGSGIVKESYAEKELYDFGYSSRTFFRTLKMGEGKFWAVFQSRQGAVIEIYGLRRVFETYSTYPFNTMRFYEVPADRFYTLRHRRLALWESIHKSKGVKANPISRETLKKYTGLIERQQRRYDEGSQVEMSPRYRPGYVDRNLKEQPRLPNIYHNQQFLGHIGQLRKVRHQLKSFRADEALEKRLYFPSNKKMLECKHRGSLVYVLIRASRRQIKGRVEYKVVNTLC